MTAEMEVALMSPYYIAVAITGLELTGSRFRLIAGVNRCPALFARICSQW
jgi:hypothetical protein